MCGIAGIAARKPFSGRRFLSESRDSLYHRGPDDAGIWWSEDGCIGLAHRRLSIVDLSKMGHQPMKYTRGGIRIIFNGMIYNFKELRVKLEDLGHKFRSTSDTEVILAAYSEWDVDCLKHLIGMFAFAIYDGHKRILFLARDRAGEKPLFYRLFKGQLVFASELKALMADPDFPRKLDLDALDSYLAFGYVSGDKCILEGVNKLPPAHYLTFDLNDRKCQIKRYWQLPTQGFEVNKIDAEQEIMLIDELHHLLQNSIEGQLIADVPIGVLLSGGVDSSLLTAVAAGKRKQVRTFTVRFPGYGKYDETEHARLIANKFGTQHFELEAGSVKPDILTKLAKQYDEPIVDSSMIPTYLVSKLVRQYCSVVLGGDGGDELFGGYTHYSRLLWLQQKMGNVPLSLRSLVSRTSENILPIGVKGRNWLRGLGFNFQNGLPPINSLFDYISRKRMMDKVRWNLSAEYVREKCIPLGTGLLQRATRLDFENYLPNDILVKVDRASMLNSLEVRAPFLDYRVIEFAFGKVPACLRATPGKRKILLKKLAARILPSNFDFNRKQGFSIPLSSWLQKEEWDSYFRQVLLDAENTFFNRKFIEHLFWGQKNGFANSERLFALLIFELWRSKYNIII